MKMLGVKAGHFHFLDITKMKKIKAYERIEMIDGKERVVCICLRSRKLCRRHCEKVTLLEDEYQGIKECFERNREVRLK